MPKKTRKEKIRAAGRRAHQDHLTPVASVRTDQSPAYTFSMEAPVEKSKITRPDRIIQHDVHAYDYVFGDLKKIFIFALLAIAIQGVLVFLLRTK